MNNLLAFFLNLARTVPAVLIALSFHEYAHGLTASWLGDDTAGKLGRLTVNPLRHIDPIGLVCMAILHFGWAKPVPVDPRNFKNPRAGMALVALAGPVMNVLLSAVCILLYYLITVFVPGRQFLDALAQFFVMVAMLSAGFAVFNILPLPPLDGSRILMLLMPWQWQFFFVKNQRYIQLILIFLLYTRVLTGPLAAARNWIIFILETAVRWILQLAS